MTGWPLRTSASCTARAAAPRAPLATGSATPPSPSAAAVGPSTTPGVEETSSTRGNPAATNSSHEIARWAPAAVSECTKDGNCERSAPQDGNNLPGFLRVDVPGKLLTDNDGNGRKTPIKSSAIVDDQLMLQGAENGKAWTIVIASDSGLFGSSVVEDDGLFAIFGRCTIP